MPDSEAAPERTSSFRRMLELERSYMIERLQSKKSREGSIPNDLPASSPLSQAENIIRRASTVDGDLKPPKSKSSLSINTKLPIPRLPGESLGLDDATTAVATPAVGTPVAAAAAAAAAATTTTTATAAASTKDTDDRSICVSPSWESHGRRKKEKKLMEKKEKEDAARTKKNRLSKLPPPASSTEALRKAEAVPDPTVARGRVKDRSKSTVAGPVSKDATQRKPRSRSSSFASLIRSPLAFRRTSVDKASPVEPEFVGGIKLELERHMANDRRLEQQQQQQQQLRDETVVHPALRQQARASGDRWPAPLQSHPPMGAATPRETGRAYPPITRQERTYRGRSIAAPPTPVTAPTTPDTGKLDQWRARVGLAPSPQPPTPSTELDMQLRDDDSDAHDRDGFEEDDDDDDDDDDYDDDRSPTQSRHRPSSSKPSRRSKAAAVGLSIFPPPARRSRDMDGEGSRRKSSDAQGGYRTAPSTPPEPPRRSPKRSPGVNLDNVLPPLPYQSDLISPSEVSPATLTPRTAKRMVVKPATQIVSRQGGARRKASKQKNQQSDESGSDEFHSPSVPSTPATSRSESDKGVAAKASKHLSTESSATGSSLTDGSSVVQLRQQDGGIHEIQAAADKVLASYREATSGSRRQRRESEPAGRSFLPVAVEQQQQQRTRVGGKVGRASVATTTPGSQPRRTKVRDASPATYLEEARRVPLSGVPARVAKARLGPPASFTLPGAEEGEDDLEESVSVTRPSLSQHEREPIAKVFVECCHCNFYHDMPSNLYEAMANPEAALSGKGTMEYGSSISMTVKCPWCRHEMSTRCCAGLAAMVFVTERLH